jgi:type IV pilus assembly protein PilQ
MKSSVRSRILSVLAVSAAVALPTAASATPDDGVNDVQGIHVEETDTQTVIRIAGDDHPTFSVYRLRTPLRLFIDVSGSQLEQELDPITLNNGVVGRIAAVEYSDDVSDVTRIVIGFDQDVPYDVVADGHDLVITVDGTLRAAGSQNVAAAPAVDATTTQMLADARARTAALEGALADAERRASNAEADILSAQLERERAEEARLAALAGQDQALDQVGQLSAAQAASQQELDRLASDLRSRDAHVEALSNEIAALRQGGADVAMVDALVSERDRAHAELETSRATLQALQQERDAALAQAATAADAQTIIAAQQQQIDALAAENQSAEARLEQLRSEWAATTGPANIADVRFEQQDGVDRVIIEVPAGSSFVSQPWEDGRAAIVFDQATLPDALRRTLDTQAFGGPVNFISSYTDTDGMVRVVAELDGAASEIIRQEADRIVWEFTQDVAAPMEMGTLTASPEPADIVAGAYTAQDSGYSLGAYRNESPFQQRPRMSNKRITIDLRDADIQNVLRLLADEGNINIVASDDVRGAITLRLRSVPLDEALAIILQSKGYGWVQEGSVLRVAPLTTFEGEYNAYIERMITEAGLEPLQVRLVPVNYGQAAQLAFVVESVLSSRGTVVGDQRSNMLIVTDVTANLDAAEQIIQQLDVQTPQILIEARIVETNDQFRRQLGIQWGGDFVADQSRGNSTGLLFPSTIGIAGGATDGQTPVAGTSSQPNFAVNLPAPAGTGSGGAIGMTLGSLSGAFNLNLRLSAAETQGSAKIISAPRIMALHNQSASITSGVSIPVSVVSAAGAQTVFFDAALTLTVTPRVTPDGNIFLDVQVTKNEPDFENTGSRGDPSIVRREARTQLLVRDGDTTVIGGIFQRNTGFSTDRIPFLGSLPIIGPLFRSSSRTDVRNELLVFITPRIVNRDLSVDVIGTGGDILRPDEE